MSEKPTEVRIAAAKALPPYVKPTFKAIVVEQVNNLGIAERMERLMRAEFDERDVETEPRLNH